MGSYIKQMLRRTSSVLATAVLLLQMTTPFVASATGNDETNQPSYWCGVNGIKFDDPEDDTISGITADFTPDDKKVTVTSDGSKTITKVVVKAGSEQSVDDPNKVYTTGPFVDLTAPENKGISHVIVCYTNVVKGSIKVVKDADPDSDDNFYFDFNVVGTSQGDVDNFELDDNGNESGTKSSRLFSNLLPATYEVSEDSASGWTLADITCTGGATVTTSLANRKATIVLGSGENVVCTFLNQKNGSIKIVKDAQPNSTDDFTFTSNVPSNTSFKLDDDSGVQGSSSTYDNDKNFQNLVPGVAYTFTESVTSGWTLDDINCSDTSSTVVKDVPSRTLTVTLKPNSAVTCTFVNKKVTPKGKIQVFKQVDEGEGGWVAANGESSDFKWGIDNENPTRNMGSESEALNVGPYSVEENVSSDYELAGWYIGEGSCSNQQNLKTTSVPVNVTADNTVSITFCNRIKEDKKVTLCHATHSEGNPFVKISVSPAAAFNGHLGDGNGNHQDGEDIIPPFTYKGMEYSQNWDEQGQAIFRNDCVKPQPKGSISGYKFNDSNFNGQWNWGEHGIWGWKINLYEEEECEVSDYSLALLTIQNESQINDCDGWDKVASTWTDVWGRYEFDDLEPGEYKVCEEQRFGWTQTYPASGCYYITIGEGNHNVHFRNFGNTKNGKLIVNKVVENSGETEETFDFNVSGWGVNKNFNDLGDGDSDQAYLGSGWYYVSELLGEDTDWNLDSVDCGEAWVVHKGNGVKVYVAPGSVVECTFVNKLKSVEVVATPLCPNGFPVLQFSVKANNFTPTQIKLTWLKSDGTSAGADADHVVEYTGSDLTDLETDPGVYTDTINWVGSNPVLPDWPGYSLVNGQWVADSTDLGGNLRPSAKLKFEVNPEMTVDVDYPTDVNNCSPTNGQVLGTSTTATLTNTGTSAVLAIVAALSLVSIASYVTLGRKRD